MKSRFYNKLLKSFFYFRLFIYINDFLLFEFKFKFVAILTILTFFYNAYTLGIRLNIKRNDRKKIKLTDKDKVSTLMSSQ